MNDTSRQTLIYRPGDPRANVNGMVPKHLAAPLIDGRPAPMVMRDIDTYQAMGVDIATGKPPVIGSRSQHRDYLRRNNYQEVGNEWHPPKRQDLPSSDLIADIKRAMGE